MSVSIKVLEKGVREMKTGQRVWINAISLSMNAIDFLRKCIRDGELILDIGEVERVYEADNITPVMNGTVIIPQMTYIKR
ncbi:MAG: hypothetical protein NC409_11440 [Clostridium sp.]|nr:hypothetical protein [Clostridium sp.]